MEELERLRCKMLWKLLEVPKTKQHFIGGLLHKTGVWSVKWRLAYRKIMLFQNIMTSEDARLVNKESYCNMGEKDSLKRPV